eukprot:TRINITY_DN9634_c0_g1_i9.p1 TRINITY_DN9634_c0_g1~~TRINITY_DN9634_c0_g1_i9.p1  ORF type:complete len:199 (+),score=-32.85 TRINITY_DN9634_c0_g1_i9:260-856(+)
MSSISVNCFYFIFNLCYYQQLSFSSKYHFWLSIKIEVNLLIQSILQNIVSNSNNIIILFNTIFIYLQYKQIINLQICIISSSISVIQIIQLLISFGTYHYCYYIRIITRKIYHNISIFSYFQKKKKKMQKKYQAIPIHTNKKVKQVNIFPSYQFLANLHYSTNYNLIYVNQLIILNFSHDKSSIFSRMKTKVDQKLQK